MSDPLDFDLLVKYLRSLRDQRYYGTVELVFTAGEFKYSRELRSRQPHEIAADVWDSMTDVQKSRHMVLFSGNERFQALLKERGKI